MNTVELMSATVFGIIMLVLGVALGLSLSGTC